jgi:aminoglycoside 6'-N-acetyltransferase
MTAEISFSALNEEQLPLLHRWLGEPHVSQWWGEPPTLQEVRAQYLPGIRGDDPTWHHIVRLAERPIGLVQWYFWSDYPGGEDGEIGARSDEAGVDYFIGEAELLGQGLGPRMLNQFLEQVVFADPRVRGIRTTIHADNRRSWRCLEKLGFERSEPLPHPKGNQQYVMTLARAVRAS